jgi:Zn-finger nucleic acid-binding protein
VPREERAVVTFCPREGAELEPLQLGASEAESCPVCRGLWVRETDVDRVVGAPVARRPAGLALEGQEVEGALRCPGCERATQPEEVRAAPGVELHSCAACARVWLDGGAASALRTALRASRGPEPGALVAAAPAAPEEPRPSVFSPPPPVELGVTLGVLLLAWGVASTRIGEVFAFMPRIQFHELGHALVAWLSGRRALPLPCGLTFWSLERSPGLVVVEVVGCLALAAVGVHRKSGVALAAAALLGAALTLGLTTPLERSEEWLVAGGTIGELLLPALAIAAFHLPLPQRARWDFWRWILLVVAALAFASVVTTWLEIASGAPPLPLGTFLGSGTSADGDLDRLLREHGWSEPGLRAFFGRVAVAAVAIAVGTHAVVGGVRWAAWRRKRT